MRGLKAKKLRRTALRHFGSDESNLEQLSNGMIVWKGYERVYRNMKRFLKRRLINAN